MPGQPVSAVQILSPRRALMDMSLIFQSRLTPLEYSLPVKKLRFIRAREKTMGITEDPGTTLWCFTQVNPHLRTVSIEESVIGP